MKMSEFTLYRSASASKGRKQFGILYFYLMFITFVFFKKKKVFRVDLQKAAEDKAVVTFSN